MTIRLIPAPEPIRGDVEQCPAHEQGRMRAAALHARRVHPGVLGELAQRELTAFADFGFRFAGDPLIARLATEILATPTPTTAAEGRTA